MSLATCAFQDSPVKHSSSITEVVFSNEKSDFLMTLPMLAHLSRSKTHRWLTWIAPPSNTKKLLADYGFDASRVRLIHTKRDEDSQKACQMALSCGNSENVVVSLSALDEESRMEFERSARIGECRGLVLRKR